MNPLTGYLFRRDFGGAGKKTGKQIKQHSYSWNPQSNVIKSLLKLTVTRTRDYFDSFAWCCCVHYIILIKGHFSRDLSGPEGRAWRCWPRCVGGGTPWSGSCPATPGPVSRWSQHTTMTSERRCKVEVEWCVSRPPPDLASALPH